MVFQAMGFSWDNNGFRLSCLAAMILVILDIQGCWSLNSDGLALLEFQARVRSDPYGIFGNWNSNDDKPCEWSGVHCFDDEVQMLDLNGLSLQGELAGQLGKLTHLKSLVLCNNHFSGVIPKEIGELTNLEVLDLRNNSLSGSVPAEIGGLQSLKSLLLSNNDFEGSLPLEIGKLNLLSELQFDENLTFFLTDDGIGCINRKFGHCIWQSSLKQLKKGDSFLAPVKGTLAHYLSALPLFNSGKNSLHTPADHCCGNPPDANETHVLQENLDNMARRRLLQQQPSNLAASPAGDVSPTEQIISVPTFKSSGSFPAVPNGNKAQPQEHVSPPAHPSSHQSQNASSPENSSTESDRTPSGGTSRGKWKYIVVILGSILLLLIIAGVMFFICRKKAVPTIGPWKTGLSGQLRKALITGVPKLNRAELEAACEDFSNIIGTFDGCTVYKGTLSSGVEISVVSVATCPAKDWTKQSELAYRKKIDKLSRVNHKNFVNLIGYCEEDEPFTRIMVFEYAPSGNLSEHLRVKDMEHLDWSARMRIIMGAAYCLQHMHELNPPVAIEDLNADCIYLTDDYAAKVADVCNGIGSSSKSALSGKGKPELLPPPDPEANVYRFGVLLLEIISAKLPYSEEHGPLVDWAADYVKEKESMKQIVDPTLKSFKEEELEIIRQVIQDCIQPDSKKRPTMKEVTLRLKELLAVTPEQATPRLSPLWWAELEILSEGA
ncbi:Non-specific serine/threonine protein kinase [Bertholletia excelsa]